MLGALRVAATSRVSARTFSSSAARSDLAKLVLIGRLGKEPEAKRTKTDTEYVLYSVATRSLLPPDGTGERQSKTTWHRVISFNESTNKYLLGLKKGSQVYVEAFYEIREPEQDADASTPQGQRQIFLRHNQLSVISTPKPEAAIEE